MSDTTLLLVEEEDNNNNNRPPHPPRHLSELLAGWVSLPPASGCVRIVRWYRTHSFVTPPSPPPIPSYVLICLQSTLTLLLAQTQIPQEIQTFPARCCRSSLCTIARSVALCLSPYCLWQHKSPAD